MSVFIKLVAKGKNQGPQPGLSREMSINSDAILGYKPVTDSVYSLSIKPEYVVSIRQFLGFSANDTVEYTTTKSDANKLDLLGKV